MKSSMHNRAVAIFLIISQLIIGFNYSELNIPLDAVKCNRSELAAAGLHQFDGVEWKEHAYSSRNLSEFLKIVPNSVLEDIIESQVAELRILEIGCGNGRALLELQSFLPHSVTFCVNKDGYMFPQSYNKRDFAHVAEHYNIPILCAAVGSEILRNQPILPHIYLSSGLEKEDFPYPRASMQLILSQHALNQGKIQPQDIFVVLPRISTLLAPGGYAALLLLYNMVDMMYSSDSAIWTGNPWTFQIVKILHANVTSAMKYSIYLYQVNNSLGMVIQRCRLHSQHRPLWGCLEDRLIDSNLPRNLGKYYNHSNAKAFQAALSATATFPISNISAWVGPNLKQHIVKYAFQYFKMLHIWLEQVEREPASILSLVDSMYSS